MLDATVLLMDLPDSMTAEERAEAAAIAEANAVKKWRPCLKCKKLIYTDRCHRLCKKCEHSNERLPRAVAQRSPDQPTRKAHHTAARCFEYDGSHDGQGG